VDTNQGRGGGEKEEKEKDRNDKWHQKGGVYRGLRYKVMGCQAMKRWETEAKSVGAGKGLRNREEGILKQELPFK